MSTFPTVALLGSHHMLGREIAAACRQRGIRPQCYGESTDVRKRITRERPHIVINAARLDDVDGAERDPNLAMRCNATLPVAIAEACAEVGALLVQFSTDQVFDGTNRRPYVETDEPCAINALGRSVAAGEEAILASGCTYLILRSGWVFAAHGDNLLSSILRNAQHGALISLPADERSRPVWAGDLASTAVALALDGCRGIVHVANSGDCSPFEFAQAATELVGARCAIEAAIGRSIPNRAPRPTFNVLDLTRITRLLGMPRHWRNALSDCLSEWRDSDGIAENAVNAVLVRQTG